MEEKRYLKRKEKALAEGNRDHLAISCNNLGDFYYQQGRYQHAVKEYQQEAELYAKLGKKLEMAKAHRMLGEIYMLLSEFQSAQEHINIYLSTVKKLQNKVEEQRAYATLGRAHLLHGQSSNDDMSAAAILEQLKQAEKAFLRSLLLIKELSGQISKLEQLDMQARCYLNIGVVKEHMEHFEESIAYIEKAIKISKEHDIYELTHLCYISMSLLYHCKKNDSVLALRYCNLALEVAKRLPNKVKKICETLITKAEILIKAGDFASAKQILTKAYKKITPDENDRNSIEKSLRIVVKICQTLDELVVCSSVDYAKCKELYERLGDGCCHLQNYTQALEYYGKMLKCAQLSGEEGKALMPSYVSLYQTYKDNKEYDKALEYLWQEYELNKDVPAEAFSTLCGIAEVLELQKQSFWTIQDVYRKAKEHAAKAGTAQAKLQRIVYSRLKKLLDKHNMHLLADELAEEANSKGIDLQTIDEDSDTESDATGGVAGVEQNTPELGDDVCLDELTDTETSDLDETEKPRPQRVTRGTRSLTIKRNNKGETQLHQACISGNLELVRRLLDQGHVVNVRDHAGWIPLHEASNHGYRDIVELLLDRGAAAAINDKGGTSCDGITPLYDACSNGYLDVVELLLERGADVTLKTDYGGTCVQGLDKWRRTSTLTAGEQAQYEHVRAALLKPLSKMGGASRAEATPLTNANVEVDGEQEHTLVNAEDALYDEDDASDDERLLRHTARSGHSRSADGSTVLKDTNKSNARSAAASLEYRHVMEQLKRPQRLNSALEHDVYTPLPSSSCSGSKQKRSALLEAEEVDDAKWLIDDLGPDKKKRRYQTPTLDLHSTAATTARTSTSKENLHDSANCTWDLEPLTPETDAFQLLLDAAGSSNPQQRRKQAQRLTLSRCSSMSSNSSVSTVPRSSRKAKHQASLLDSGFSRFRSVSPASSEDAIDLACTATHLRATAEPDSTTTSIHLLISPAKRSPIKVQAAPVLSSTHSFKVKVEDELLLVPVERRKLHDVNIRWLAEEAARRYYNLVGLKPVLRLKTADGFAYEENDAVSVALEQSMILATVLEWKIAPLAQRYEEMCQQLKTDMNADVRAVLERAQASNSIQLEDHWLTPPHIEPLCKAVLHQTHLRVLELSNNCLQNEGCRQLAKALPTLRQLKVLSLSGNFITAEGLECLLASAVMAADKFDGLEELNLSQNPLGNACLRLLDKYCNSGAGKALQQLLLSQCVLTNLYDYDLCFYQLSALDLSYNRLTAESLRKLLGKLNASRLQNLCLSYTSCSQQDARSTDVNAEQLVSFFESGTCEKFRRLQLGGLSLSDAHIHKLVQCLSKANDLELFDITDNEKLSAMALQNVIDCLPQLRKLVAVNCSRLLDDTRLQQLTELKHLPNFMSLSLDADSDASAQAEHEQRLQALWRAHWGEKAHVKSYACHLLLYVNDKDLIAE